jgi:hypothetical protein
MSDEVTYYIFYKQLTLPLEVIDEAEGDKEEAEQLVYEYQFAFHCSTGVYMKTWDDANEVEREAIKEWEA